MSLQTTMARSSARAAERAWRDHFANCSKCATARRRRPAAELCPDGAQVWAAHQAAATELAKQRRLDRLPSPDQETLT